MNRDEAKDILLLYRHDSPSDKEDPQVGEALSLAQQDPELARWIEMHCARQFVVREKLRQMPVPDGLKEQIISEHAASLRKPQGIRQLVLALAMLIAMLCAAGAAWWNHQASAQDTLLTFQSQMAAVALRGYGMDFPSEDAAKIRDYLKTQRAPSDYALSAGLTQAGQTGCAIENWQDKKVALVCFRSGRPMAAGAQSDLWLFVVDQSSVKDAPTDSQPHLARVGTLLTATWARDGKLYFLGLEGEAADLKKYL